MITNMSINTFRFILSSLFFVARKCKGFSGVVICLCGFEIFGFRRLNLCGMSREGEQNIFNFICVRGMVYGSFLE